MSNIAKVYRELLECSRWPSGARLGRFINSDRLVIVKAQNTFSHWQCPLFEPLASAASSSSRALSVFWLALLAVASVKDESVEMDGQKS